MNGKIRKSALAGSWYPGDAGKLRADVEQYIRNVPETDLGGGEPIGLVAPHAGYMYSGQVAAYAYKQLINRFYDAVVLVGPSHRSRFRGVSVYPQGGYETPLGVMPVDEELAAGLLAEGDMIQALPEAHLSEHSLEIQLPFLQVALGQVPVVPLMMGDQSETVCRQLAGAIVRASAGRSVLVVGSSDLSHFHSYDAAVRLDRTAVNSISGMDASGLLGDVDRGACEACGGGPAAVAILASKAFGAERAVLLKYANSGDITGDRGSVVGYASIIFLCGGQAKAFPKDSRGEAGGIGLTASDKNILLDIVKATIECELQDLPVPDFDVSSDVLREKRGAFVTLKKTESLRGCIGYIRAVKPLYRAVEEMAAAAAFRDPRFPPVKRDELKKMSIEISVLTPLREIRDISEIEVGRHGIYIVRGDCSGLLLPQVAVEYGWGREVFLSETCHKAGLPPTAWRDNQTRIFIFSADVFGREAWDSTDVV